jgi:ABC-type sugar transport system ATPase subunit
MAHLSLERLRKTFGASTVAVSDVSFDVADQEAVFLLGPSGAGKTTTLRLVAGLEDPDSGDVRIGGRSVVRETPGQRNVAMVYDKHSLFPHLSVFENMAYPLRIRRMPDAAMRARIGSVAETLQIAELLSRRPGQLSGGQMQRVAIGRALVRDADVFLMDEPISHLDAQLRARMRVEFKRLQKDFKATILYVSHDQLEAMTMSDRIIVLNHGVVEQIGPPQEIFDRPATIFVATFVGEPAMNTAVARVAQASGGYGVTVGSTHIPLDESWLAASGVLGRGAADVVLGIRPHHLRMTAPDDPGPCVVRGTLYAYESLGSRVLYDIDVGDRIVRVLGSSGEASLFPREMNAPVAFGVDPDALYLFDAQTGKTLAHARFSSGEVRRRTAQPEELRRVTA